MLTAYLPHSAQKVADCLMRREGLLNKGWRYDYGKGFTHDHINDYNTAAGAYFSC